MDSDSDENVEVGINEGNEQRSHFISIKYDERFKKGLYIDIYASLFSDFTSKIIINLNENDNIKNLMQKIKENVEIKYEHLSGLNRLQVKDLKKVTGADFNKGASSVSRALKNPMSSVPNKGNVSNYLKANDHLLFDIDSDDIWIKFKLVIEAPSFNLPQGITYVEAEFEVKFDKLMTGEQFQKVTQKLVISIWNQYWQDSKDLESSEQGLIEKEHTNFVLSEFRFTAIDVGAHLELLDFDSEGTSAQNNQSGRLIGTMPGGGGRMNMTQQNSLSHQKISVQNPGGNGLLYKMPRRKYNVILTNVPVDQTIGEVFHYQNNLVKIKSTFVTLRDLYQKQLLASNTQSMIPNQSQMMDVSNAFSIKLQSFKSDNPNRNMVIERYVIGPQANTLMISPNSRMHYSYRQKQVSQIIKRNFNFSKQLKGIDSHFSNQAGSAVSNAQQLYHLIDTDGTDKNGGYEITFIEEDQEIQNNQNALYPNQDMIRHSINDDFERNIKEIDEEGEEDRKRREETFKKQKTDQMKIPIMFGANGQSSNFVGLARKSSNVAIIPAISGGHRLSYINSKVADLLPSNVPDFGGNLINKELTSKLLFSVIMGHIVLPKKNPILIEDPNQLIPISNIKDQLEFEINETSEIGAFFYNLKPDIESSKKNKHLSAMNNHIQSPPFQNFGLINTIGGNMEVIIEEEPYDQSAEKRASMENNPFKFSTTQTLQSEQKKRQTTINESLAMDIDSDEDVLMQDYMYQKHDTNIYNETIETIEKTGSIDTHLPHNLSDKQNSQLKSNQSASLENKVPAVLEEKSINDKYFNVLMEGNQQLHAPLIEGDSSSILMSKNRSSTQQKGHLTTDQQQKERNITALNLMSPGDTSRKVTQKQKDRKSSFLNTEEKSSGSSKKNNHQSKKPNIFTNIISLLKKKDQPNSNLLGSKNLTKGGAGTPFDLSQADQISEFELLQKVQLPQFLLTHEEYQLLAIPQVKNFIIGEKDKQLVLASLRADEIAVNQTNSDQEQPQQVSGVNRKTVIIIVSIILLACMFAAGIYLAIELSTQQ